MLAWCTCTARKRWLCLPMHAGPMSHARPLLCPSPDPTLPLGVPVQEAARPAKVPKPPRATDPLPPPKKGFTAPRKRLVSLLSRTGAGAGAQLGWGPPAALAWAARQRSGLAGKGHGLSVEYDAGQACPPFVALPCRRGS